MNEDPVRATPWRPCAKRDTIVSETQGQVLYEAMHTKSQQGQSQRQEEIRGSLGLWGGEENIIAYDYRDSLWNDETGSPVMNVTTATELYV